MRQKYSDRDALDPWFSQNYMPTAMVYSLLDQAADMGFSGAVILSYYNEPTLDRRLSEFGAYAKERGFRRVVIATTGDTLDEDMATSLDGCFHELSVSLYENSTEERKEEILGLFRRTRIRFTNGLHVNLHVPPPSDLQQRRCFNAVNNMVINHRGDFLACCQEIVPHFDLGNAFNTPLVELWEGKMPLVTRMLTRGERARTPYCTNCSHGAVKKYIEVVQQ